MAIPNTFVNGTVADAGSVNENFAAVNNSSHYYFIGSTSLIGSTAGAVSLGSILIPAGSLTNPCRFCVDYRGSGLFHPAIEFSGLSENISIDFSASTAIKNPVGHADLVVGSPYLGMVRSQAQEMNAGISTALSDSQGIDNFDTSTEDIVVKFNVLTIESGAQYTLLSITAGGMY